METPEHFLATQKSYPLIGFMKWPGQGHGFPKTMYKYVIKIIDWTLKKVCIIYIFILLIWKVCTY